MAATITHACMTSLMAPGTGARRARAARRDVAASIRLFCASDRPRRQGVGSCRQPTSCHARVGATIAVNRRSDIVVIRRTRLAGEWPEDEAPPLLDRSPASRRAVSTFAGAQARTVVERGGRASFRGNDYLSAPEALARRSRDQALETNGSAADVSLDGAGIPLQVVVPGKTPQSGFRGSTSPRRTGAAANRGTVGPLSPGPPRAGDSSWRRDRRDGWRSRRTPRCFVRAEMTVANARAADACRPGPVASRKTPVPTPARVVLTTRYSASQRGEGSAFRRTLRSPAKAGHYTCFSLKCATSVTPSRDAATGRRRNPRAVSGGSSGRGGDAT